VLPLLKQLIPEGINFGTNLLVEFPSDSLWYEASFTIAAQALRNDVRTEYHVFQHTPSDVRDALVRLGLDVERLEKNETLQVLDSYTVQTGVGVAESGRKKIARDFVTSSMKVSDWSISGMKALKSGTIGTRKRGLHIDDNTLVLVRYNSEPAIIDFWRTRAISTSRVEENVAVYSILTGMTSDSFRSQFESLHDGIIDFKTEERADEVQHFVRVRILRGKRCDSRWRRITVQDNGEVTLESRANSLELDSH
jgi:KaiC/GvpD/RAD55 family RecA-like ATPase